MKKSGRLHLVTQLPQTVLAMADHEDRGAATNRVRALEVGGQGETELVLRQVVQQRRRLVDEQYGRGVEKGSGQTQQLALPLRQPPARLPQLYLQQVFIPLGNNQAIFDAQN